MISKLLPRLEPSLHKGEAGKIGVIGGSRDYTGAPYYAGAASLRAGGDLSHIFCPEEASTPIKSYSPELMVHPVLNDTDSLIKWFDACTSMVIGPGLGRDEKLAQGLEKILYTIS